MSSYEAYIPVSVGIDEETGRIYSAYVDFDGAPWMYVGDEANIWGLGADGEGVWTRDEVREAVAIDRLNELIGLADFRAKFDEYRAWLAVTDIDDSRHDEARADWLYDLAALVPEEVPS